MPNVSCTCKKDQKVPPQEHDFLSDQRSLRKMCIGNVDRLTTADLEKRIERQQQTMRLVKPSVSRAVAVPTAEFNPLESGTRIAKVAAIDAMTKIGQMP